MNFENEYSNSLETVAELCALLSERTDVPLWEMQKLSAKNWLCEDESIYAKAVLELLSEITDCLGCGLTYFVITGMSQTKTPICAYIADIRNCTVHYSEFGE